MCVSEMGTLWKKHMQKGKKRNKTQKKVSQKKEKWPIGRFFNGRRCVSEGVTDRPTDRNAGTPPQITAELNPIL